MLRMVSLSFVADIANNVFIMQCWIVNKMHIQLVFSICIGARNKGEKSHHRKLKLDQLHKTLPKYDM